MDNLLVAVLLMSLGVVCVALAFITRPTNWKAILAFVFAGLVLMGGGYWMLLP